MGFAHHGASTVCLLPIQLSSPCLTQRRILLLGYQFPCVRQSMLLVRAWLLAENFKDSQMQEASIYHRTLALRFLREEMEVFSPQNAEALFMATLALVAYCPHA